MAEEKKVRYTKCRFDIDKDAALDAIHGNIEGFCNGVTVREVTTKNGPRKVADVSVNTIIPDSKVKNLFGDKFLNEYHSVNFRVSYWGFAAENIEKYPPQKGQKVLCLIKGMKTRENTGKDGKVYLSVEATGCDGMDVNSAFKEGGESALKSASAGGATGGGAVNPSDASFEEFDEFVEEELPF